MNNFMVILISIIILAALLLFTKHLIGRGRGYQLSLSLFAAVFLSASVSAVTFKEGRLIQDETWSGEILVAGPVIVPKNITLTIEPGTMVKFKAYRGYKNPGGKIGLHINGGTLKAIGRPKEQIWFTSGADDPYNGDWAGIVITESKDSTLKYVIIEFAELGMEQYFSSAKVSHSIVRYSNIEGLYAEQSSPVFEHNTFYRNAYHDISLENYNHHAVVRNNLFKGGQSPIVFHDTTALLENNFFMKGYRDPRINVVNASNVAILNNRFEEEYLPELITTDYSSRAEAKGNKFGEKTTPNFDYEDIIRHRLPYHPGREGDRYRYVFDEKDETRRIVKRIGGIGMGWALEYADGYLWKEVDVKIDPRTGRRKLIPTDEKKFRNIRGLTFDGECFWANSFSERKVIKYQVKNDRVQVLGQFDLSPYGAAQAIASDKNYLYIPIEGELYQFTKNGELVKKIKFDYPLAGPIVWTGKYFWAVGGDGILKFTKSGKLVGRIYRAAYGTWGLAWDGKYLWTLQRTSELQNDPKIFQIEILNDSLKTGHRE